MSTPDPGVFWYVEWTYLGFHNLYITATRWCVLVCVHGFYGHTYKLLLASPEVCLAKPIIYVKRSFQLGSERSEGSGIMIDFQELQ